MYHVRALNIYSCVFSFMKPSTAWVNWVLSVFSSTVLFGTRVNNFALTTHQAFHSCSIAQLPAILHDVQRLAGGHAPQCNQQSDWLAH